MGTDVASMAINVTICGLAIVFGTLILLVAVFWAFGRIMDLVNGASKSKKNKTAEAATPAPASAPAPAAAAPSDTEDDELIAVISAAVSVALGGDGRKYAVRSVRPVTSGGRSVWAAAGIAQNTKAF